MNIQNKRIFEQVYNTSKQQFETRKGKPSIEFNFFNCNRDLNNKNLKEIRKSIIDKGQLNPITVTSDKYIVDGQHRYIVLKELNMPIWYTINNKANKHTIEDMNNARMQWGSQDMIKNQATNGDSQTKLLLNQYSTYDNKFKLNAINEAFSKELTSVRRLLKRKKYTIDLNQGRKVLDTCLRLEEITRKQSLTSTFVRAMVVVYKLNPNYSIEFLLKRSKMNKINLYNNTSDTAREIIEVYNYRLKTNKLVTLK